MIEKFIHNKRTRVIVAGSVIAATAVVLHYWLAKQGPSYKEVIIGIGALLAAVILFGREKGVRYGFVLWVLTLTLGYRTVAITPELAVHPAEVLLWLLLVCVVAQRRLVSTARLGLPVWLWVFVPFWVLAWWPMIGGAAPWDRMLNEFRNFLLLIPLLIVVSVVLKRENYWRHLMVAFFVAGSFIALMGILEYWFPEVSRFFPAFIKDVKPMVTEEGFPRAQFSFWGGPPATFICLLALPCAIALWGWWGRSSRRFVIAFGSLLQILAIYIGGYRSIWLLLLVQVLIGCLIGLKKQGAIVALLCLVIAVGGYQLVPRTHERAMSGIAALQGNPTDSSATGRQQRVITAVANTLESPFGSGWSFAGWVHSDFLQVAENLGIFGGLIFLGGYFYTLLRLGRRVLPKLKFSEDGALGLSLLLSFVAVGGLLAMEGVSVLPQMVLPVWFVWALTEVWLRQTAEAFEVSHVRPPVLANTFMPVRVSPGVNTDA